jgi:hypothetical protein
VTDDERLEFAIRDEWDLEVELPRTAALQSNSQAHHFDQPYQYADEPPREDEPPPPDDQDADLRLETQPDDEPADEFWHSRLVLKHLLNFARARRVGPWALLGCVLVRAVAAVPPNVVLPAMIGGYASLNLFLGVVSVSGGGKGTAEAASLDAIDLVQVPIFGPGSGEGIGHLFYRWDKQADELKQHTASVIISAAEIDTLTALKFRQASTLFPELRKVWMGEPLGFAYVAAEKRLTIPRHSYRLCLVTGIQPANAAPLLDDAAAGTPGRFLWLPADDPDAPDQRPPEPEQWPDPLWHPGTKLMEIGLGDGPDPVAPMAVCDTAKREIDRARLDQLRGSGSEVLDGHALLAQLKVAAALALLEGRTGEVSEDDWRLARIVRRVSDQTRLRVMRTLERERAKSNHARAEADAHRAIIVDDKLTEHATQRVGRLIMSKLGTDWIAHAALRRDLPGRDRQYFEGAITALVAAGQVIERAVQADHVGHEGTEYRRAR